MPAGCDCTCLSSNSLSQTVLFLSPVQLCLIVLSALFSLPPSLSLPPFFFSLFPSSLPPLHYITLALTHYQCPMALLPFVPHRRLIICGGLHRTLLMELLCWKQLQKSSSITVQWIRALCKRRYWYSRRGGNSEWCLWGLWKSCFVVFAALHQSESKLYQVRWSANIVVSFRSQTLWGLLPSLEPKGRMDWETKCWIKLFWSMWVSVKEEWGRNVREGEQETGMRRVMGVSVVPALWKGMLQWCHGCRREHAYWWHNPQTSMLRPPNSQNLH